MLSLLKFSDFGKRFKEASENIGAKSRHDGFDTAMIEISVDYWRQFMDEIGEIN